MYQAITGRIKQIEVDHRTIEFIASHELVDSYSEVIKIAGIDLARFAKNPVLLLGHTYSNSAVAEVRNLRKTYVDGFPALVGSAYFPTRPNSNEALQDVRSHLLNAVSVGVDHVEKGPPELPGQRGITIVKCSLYEISLVTIPACATCLITQKEYNMKSACNCTELDLTPEQIAQIPVLVDQAVAMALRGHAVATRDEIDLDDADVRRVLADLPAIVTAAFHEAVRQEVRTAMRRLQGKVD